MPLLQDPCLGTSSLVTAECIPEDIDTTSIREFETDFNQDSSIDIFNYNGSRGIGQQSGSVAMPTASSLNHDLGIPHTGHMHPWRKQATVFDLHGYPQSHFYSNDTIDAQARTGHQVSAPAPTIAPVKDLTKKRKQLARSYTAK